MCRLHSQRAEQADAPVSLYPNDAHKESAILKAKQIEAAAAGEIGNAKLGISKKRLDFRIEVYDFGTHIPCPQTHLQRVVARQHSYLTPTDQATLT